jgi:hypothetical protein
MTIHGNIAVRQSIGATPVAKRFCAMAVAVIAATHYYAEGAP